LQKRAVPLADRIVTTSPDVTVSTNLGAWVNQRGLFRRQELADVFRKGANPVGPEMGRNPGRPAYRTRHRREQPVPDARRLGLAGDLWGERLFPIGTVYDPFIARGLDALNYACYQDARFMLVATPSG
jgi:pyruvate dehydrogenase E1 component